jgi:hypothetical protein
MDEDDEEDESPVSWVNITRIEG